MNLQSLNFQKYIQSKNFSHLCRRKFEVIPVMNIPKGSLCSIRELDLNTDNPSEEVETRQELYAKIALLVFYPCRKKRIS